MESDLVQSSRFLTINSEVCVLSFSDVKRHLLHSTESSSIHLLQKDRRWMKHMGSYWYNCHHVVLTGIEMVRLLVPRRLVYNSVIICPCTTTHSYTYILHTYIHTYIQCIHTYILVLTAIELVKLLLHAPR